MIKLILWEISGERILILLKKIALDVIIAIISLSKIEKKGLLVNTTITRNRTFQDNNSDSELITVMYWRVALSHYT